MKLFIVIMILVIYVVCKKNSFNSLQKSIKHGESEIGIQIAKRRDCLDDALRIAKLSYEKEVEGIERLTAGDKLERLAFLDRNIRTCSTQTAISRHLDRQWSLTVILQQQDRS